MQNKLSKLITAGIVLTVLTSLITFPPQAKALHGLDDGEADFRFHFGFPISEEVTCECSLFNTLYRAGRFGLPRPLPPSPTEGFPGPLVTIPFWFPWETIPGLNLLQRPDEHLYPPIQEGEFVLGNTHNPIIGGPICVDIVFRFGIPPVSCEPRWGWLWRDIGSSASPNPTALAETTESYEDEIENLAEQWEGFFGDLDFSFLGISL